MAERSRDYSCSSITPRSPGNTLISTSATCAEARSSLPWCQLGDVPLIAIKPKLLVCLWQPQGFPKPPPSAACLDTAITASSSRMGGRVCSSILISMPRLQDGKGSQVALIKALAFIPTLTSQLTFSPPSLCALEMLLPFLAMILTFLSGSFKVKGGIKRGTNTSRDICAKAGRQTESAGEKQNQENLQKLFPGPLPNWGASGRGSIWMKATANPLELM